MIKPKELNKISNREGVRQQQIEKDYIISWILWGIFNNTLLKHGLILKGGTCIKKIYIENYRYSEDMDFTINPNMESDISDEDIYDAFNDVFVQIKETTNINLTIPEDSKDVQKSTGSIKFYIDYVGPLGGNGDHVKLDITRGEKLEFDIEHRTLLHEYSDLEEEDKFTIQCYGLNEITIEKMAALMGRTVPRDLYDFGYLTNTEGIELQDIFYEFERKAKHKGNIPSEFIKKITEKKKTFENAWKKNLSHQIKELPEFKEVWRDFNKQLRKLEKIKAAN